MIRLAPDLALPVDAGTQTVAIFGKRGSGKTNTAVVFAEELFKAKVPFAVVDPVDVWYGLKASRDGRGPGLGVYVFGGRHADLPLEPSGGALVADVLIDHRISAVLSVKHFTGGERSRFVTDFAKRIYQRNTEPLHVFLEEAHELAPQDLKAVERSAEMVGAVARLWKLGRSCGIGGSAITQRPASLSKNITTQAEILVVHRTIGPQDVAAIKAWIQYHGERDDILPQLSTLQTGEAFVWAPDFPEGKPIGLRRVRIRERETFDSSATPRAGEHRAEPRALAPVDLEKLRDRMAATIERAKADDPKALRAEIATLRREMAAAVAAKVVADPEALERVRSDGFAAGEQAARRVIATMAASATARSERVAIASGSLVSHLKQALDCATAIGDASREPLDVPEIEFARASGPSMPRSVAGDGGGQPARRALARPENQRDLRSHPLSARSGEARMLEVLAQHFPTGLREGQWAALAGLKRSGGTWSTYKSRLRTAGHLRQDGALFYATDEGVAAAGVVPEKPTSVEEVIALWRSKPGMGPVMPIVNAVVWAPKHPVDRAELAEAVGLTASGGTFSTYLSRARTAELIADRDGGLVPGAAFEGLG